MKKTSLAIVILAVGLLINFSGFSQATILNLPDLLPPSPDVSAITKGAELSSVMHTGAASASIPIYKIQVKDFVLPISLNYASNGYKPDEVPSRVGIGWNLEAGGVISRIVQGKPDDESIYADPPGLILKDQQTFNWIESVVNPALPYDTRPDEFRYSVHGLSGKFIYKKDGSILQIPYNNIKIDAPLQTTLKIPDVITLTDTKGVKYVFAENGEKEKTLLHTMTGGYINKQDIQTAWILSRIILPTGENINFYYTEVTVNKNNGYANAIKKHLHNDSYCAEGYMPVSFCPEYIEDGISSHAFIKYNSYCLTSISVEGVEEVNFTYQDRPWPDETGDNRLIGVTVTNYQSNRIVKQVKLNYDTNWPNTSAGTPFSLSQVSFVDPTNPDVNIQNYDMEYNEGILPRRGMTGNYDLGIDFLGFRNAGGISADKHYSQDLSTDADFAANINAMQPNGNVAQNRMLKKITFPTGGSESFFYEPNLSTYWDSIIPDAHFKASVQGVGSAGGGTLYTTNFTTNVEQDAEFYGSVSWLGSGPAPDNPGLNPKTAHYRVINTLTNAEPPTGGGWLSYGYFDAAIPLTHTVHLMPDIPYRLELEVEENTETFGKAAIVYKENVPKVWTQVNTELCGVRVHKIVSHDPVTNKDISKFFSYRSLLDTAGVLSASAKKLYQPNYISEDDNFMLCSGPGAPPLICKSKVFSTNSIATVEINQAAGVVYTHILESDDSLYAHGCTEHYFDTRGQLLGLPVMNGDVPDKPLDLNDDMNGKELQTIYYNNERHVLKKITNSYTSDSRITGSQEYNYLIRKRYTIPNLQSPLLDIYFEPYDVNQYDIYTVWNHLDQTETQEFDLINNTVHTNTVSYTYAHTENILPTSIITHNSEEIELKTNLKYPNDFSTQEPYHQMIEKNILEPVVRQDNYKGGKHLNQTFTQYWDYNHDGSVLVPEILQQQKSDGLLENRIHFYQYDQYSNPIEVSKENDTRISYIWDYNHSLPIAEITNASFGKGVAYTSFEADGKGGWDFDGTIEAGAGAVTGTKMYQLYSGDVKYHGEFDNTLTYIVTYWAKEAGVLVNGIPGVEMVNKNGWTLYKHELTSLGTDLEITGSTVIDELRLYPRDAFMKTFTYLTGTGLSETSDANSIYQRYEYDGFNRLIRIRDWDRNIIKQMEYKYGETITPCANPNADWQATGQLRCKYIFSHDNLIITQEREELDHNNCSLTYNSKRWVSTGSQGNCPSDHPCLEPEYKWINGACVAGTATDVVSEYLGNMTWSCTFHYVYPDGSVSEDQTTTSDSPCLLGF